MHFVCSVQRFSVCVRTRFRTVWRNQAQENAAPEGRPNLAQRFSAGKSGKKDSSPGGTTEFSRTRFSPAAASKSGLAARVESKIRIRACLQACRKCRVM